MNKKSACTIFTLCTFLISCFLSCCNSTKLKKSKIQEFPVSDKIILEKIDLMQSNHSYLSEENLFQTVTVTGSLRENSDSYFLYENEDMRNCVIFTLIFEDEKIKDEAKFLNGQTVTLEGIVTDASETWNKTVKVNKLILQ